MNPTNNPNPLVNANSAPPSLPVVPTIPTNTPPPQAPFLATTNMGNGNNSGKRKTVVVVAILLITLLGLGSGLFLVSNRQLFEQKAWDCGNYKFMVQEDGTVKVTNNSQKDEQIQKAQVYINSELVATFDVPALSKGSSATLGTVEIPEGTVNWLVQGTTDCSSTGTLSTQQALRCVAIKAFNTNWNELSAASLSGLKKGDTVRFTVLGSGSQGNYDAARFTINSVSLPETSQKSPSGDYYQEYVIPEGTTSFNVVAEVRGAEDGVWY